MVWSPIWIVPGIALVVALIVAGPAVAYRLQGKSLDASLFTLAAITVFTTGACLGFLLTNFSSPTPETWWWALAGRVGWTLGGGVLLAVAVLFEARSAGSARQAPVLGLLAGLVVVGALLCVNPLRDLLDGPLELRGTADLEVQRTHRTTRGGSAIWATLKLRQPNGAAVALDSVGWGANEVEEKLAACAPGQDVRIQVLRHVERLLAVTCE